MKHDIELEKAILIVAFNHDREYIHLNDLQSGLSSQFPKLAWSGKITAHVRLMQEEGWVKATFIQEQYFDEDVDENLDRFRLTAKGQAEAKQANDSPKFRPIL